MKTCTIILVAACAVLAALPILHPSPPARSESPPGFRVSVADRLPCEAPAFTGETRLLMHRIAPAPDVVVFDLPGDEPVEAPAAAFLPTFLRAGTYEAAPKFPLRL